MTRRFPLPPCTCDGAVQIGTCDRLCTLGAPLPPPPSIEDAAALLRRGMSQLRAWHEWYGRHQCGCVPPAGDVRWLEEADAFLAGPRAPSFAQENRNG
jgi:hypothetical protein